MASPFLRMTSIFFGESCPPGSGWDLRHRILKHQKLLIWAHSRYCKGTLVKKSYWPDVEMHSPLHPNLIMTFSSMKYHHLISEVVHEGRIIPFFRLIFHSGNKDSDLFFNNGNVLWYPHASSVINPHLNVSRPSKSTKPEFHDWALFIFACHEVI